MLFDTSQYTLTQHVHRLLSERERRSKLLKIQSGGDSPSLAECPQQHPSWHPDSDSQQEELFSQPPLTNALLRRFSRSAAPPCLGYAANTGLGTSVMVYLIYNWNQCVVVLVYLIYNWDQCMIVLVLVLVKLV